MKHYSLVTMKEAVWILSSIQIPLHIEALQGLVYSLYITAQGPSSSTLIIPISAYGTNSRSTQYFAKFLKINEGWSSY